MAEVFGYVFIEVRGRHIADVLDSVGALEGVQAAHAVTGRYDIIAQVAAADFAELANHVLANLRQIEGVHSTETSVAIWEPREEL